MNNISKSSIAYLCFIWCFAVLLGVAVGFNAPFILLAFGSILYLL